MTNNAAAPIAGHDVSTTEGGRAYLAEYFQKRLGRHDFAQYIAKELAGDFACTMAKHLQLFPEEPAAGPWIDGSPPSPWGSEAFLAFTVHGDAVVLSPLPEDYAYDFQTADGTYIMRGNIKKWAQLSTSQFVVYDSQGDDKP